MVEQLLPDSADRAALRWLERALTIHQQDHLAMYGEEGVGTLAELSGKGQGRQSSTPGGRDCRLRPPP